MSTKKVSGKLLVKEVKDSAVSVKVNDVDVLIYSELDLDQRAQMLDEALGLIFQNSKDGIVYRADLVDPVCQFMVVKYATNVNCTSLRSAGTIYKALSVGVPVIESPLTGIEYEIRTLILDAVDFRKEILIKESTSISDTLLSAMAGLVLRVNNLIDNLPDMSVLQNLDNDTMRAFIESVSSIGKVSADDLVRAVADQQPVKIVELGDHRD